MQIKNFILIDDSEATNVFHEIVLKERNTHTNVFPFITCQNALDSNFPSDLNYKNTLLLLDLNMPEMNAWEFLDHIKRHKHPFSKLKIALLSTGVNKASSSKMLQYTNIIEQLKKPLTLDQVEFIESAYF